MVPRRRPPQAGVGQGLGLSTGLALLLTLSALLTPSTGSASTRWARFHRLPDLENHVINPSVDSLVGQHSHVTSPAQCAAACLTTTACSSFFLLHDVAQCLLHAIVFLGKDEATARPDTSYWRISHDLCPMEEDFFFYRPLSLCYKYYWSSVLWHVANSTCNSEGLSLVKVDTQDKFEHLYTFLRGSSGTRNHHVSIGANEINGNYRWTDGSDVTWFNWASGEPSSSAENCVNMAWFYFFKWNDVPCSDNSAAMYRFICEKTL